MTVEDFVLAWGADALVRLPPDATGAVPSADRDFLVRAGLPALVRYSYGSGGLVTFCRLSAGLSPVLDQETVGPPLPREWSTYSVLGDEFFCNGSAWWCVHGPSGHVARIDIEIDPPVEVANSSVRLFAAALLAATEWTARRSTAPADWPAEVRRLRGELERLDPPCMAAGRNFWPAYLAFAEGEGPELPGFERGTRPEGEQALRAGPW